MPPLLPHLRRRRHQPRLALGLAAVLLLVGAWQVAAGLAARAVLTEQVAELRVLDGAGAGLAGLAAGELSTWITARAQDPATTSAGAYLVFRDHYPLSPLATLPASFPAAASRAAAPTAEDRLLARWHTWAGDALPQAASSPPAAADPRQWLLGEAASWRPLEHSLHGLLADTAGLLQARTEALDAQLMALVLEAGGWLLAALACGLLAHAYRRAAAPVATLTDLGAAMRAVTQGDLTARAPIHGTADGAQLATDFNDMVAVLVETLAAEQQVVEELRRKTADLEAANRHKSEFLARVSHELKTPLNAIIGFADLLQAGRPGPLTDKQRDYCQRIFGAGQHLLAIISDLIDLSRLDLGGLTLTPAPTDLAAAIHEAMALLTPQLAAKEHTLNAELAADLGSLTLDRRRLVQVLINLLGNAIKFTPPGGTLTVLAQREVRARLVTITVRDTGIGIAPADQQRIFAEFVQLESPLQRHHEGVGIGLALSRRLVTLMAGTLTVTSTPAHGSAFTITLPVNEADKGTG